MKVYFYIIVLILIFICCVVVISQDKYFENDESNFSSNRNTKREIPPLNIYNMGDVPSNDIDNIVKELKKVYPNTKYAGKMLLVDSAYIKNDPKGENRYQWSKLLPHLRKISDTKRGLTLVIVNAEICNWDKKKKGSHANFGMSNLGGHISTISYQRLKVNHLNNINDMMKVVIHELGHSVARLVIEREDLRYHCPNNNCLMKDANNGFPYRGLTSFCPSCSKAMKAKGFNLDALQLKK